MVVDFGDLEQRQAGLLGQPQSGAHHQIAEGCVAGGVAAPKRPISQTRRQIPTNANITPPPIRGRRQPSQVFSMAILRRLGRRQPSQCRPRQRRSRAARCKIGFCATKPASTAQQ